MIKNILSDLMIVAGILLITAGLFILIPDNTAGEYSADARIDYFPENNPVDYIEQRSDLSKIDRFELNHYYLGQDLAEKSSKSNKLIEFNKKMDIINKPDPVFDRSWTDLQKDILAKSDSGILLKDLEQLEKKAESSEREKVRVVIASGLSSNKVAELLSKKEIIEKEKFIRALVVFDAEEKIKSGSYLLSKDSDILNLFSKILIGGGE